MSRNTSVSLGDHFAEFVDAQVQSGQYGSASDVIRVGLRFLESHETQMRALQEALQAGDASGASGAPEPFDSEAFLARMRATHSRSEPGIGQPRTLPSPLNNATTTS
ncbi:putative transcriptional regulators, CopG/Arc/MetJ DNA-binding domain protein [Burkholderia lata]|uniref:Transcriptional regulators, CopG/Arc/MetJ DNA-binding domain protein n=1 Tax=Burkholderia lata (strain ATCC 17760 / DSM 23089 / LMG 22485 / NCIMB 9086 / R18194 / 383) TaxID=482957 RepID=Q39GM3_BURL3|nr:putative transcriptional regulators, CopG/Arc/MetJ DNA-binding domain protein [Burkholderia lata]